MAIVCCISQHGNRLITKWWSFFLTMWWRRESWSIWRKCVYLKGSGGYTPLHYCSLSDNQSPTVRLQIAKMLLQADASLTIKDSNLDTSYEYARVRKRKELAKYLWSQLSPEQQAREKPLPPDWWEKKSTLWVLNLSIFQTQDLKTSSKDILQAS